MHFVAVAELGDRDRILSPNSATATTLSSFFLSENEKIKPVKKFRINTHKKKPLKMSEKILKSPREKQNMPMKLFK